MTLLHCTLLTMKQNLRSPILRYGPYHQDQPNDSTIFHLFGEEILTLILRHVLSGSNGIYDFESLLLAYPHLQLIVLFVTDAQMTSKSYKGPFSKLFGNGKEIPRGSVLPLSLDHFNNSRYALISIASVTRALNIFVFDGQDYSVMSKRLTPHLACQYGRNIPLGSIIVSCFHDERLLGHQSLVSLAKSSRSTLIHQPLKSLFDSAYLCPTTGIVDGSSWLFRLFNSRWISKDSNSNKKGALRGLVRSVSRLFYDYESTKELYYNAIEIINCHQLQGGTLETKDSQCFRIKIAPGCRSSDVKGSCSAPYVVIQCRQQPQELTIEYKSTLVPRVKLVGSLLHPDPKTRPALRNTFALTNKSVEEESMIDSQHKLCEHGTLPSKAWSSKERQDYFKMTGKFEIIRYDSVPSFVLWCTSFGSHISEIFLYNLQPGMDKYGPQNFLAVVPWPVPITCKTLRRLKISARVTFESMRRLPIFGIDSESTVALVLEELEGSNQFWDLRWLFDDRELTVYHLFLRNTCDTGSDFLKLAVNPLTSIRVSKLATLIMAGYSPEFLWLPNCDVVPFSSLRTLQIDVTDMPVINNRMGSDLRLREYFPFLCTLKLSGRLSRSWKWRTGVIIDIQVPQSLQVLEIRPAIPLQKLIINNSVAFDGTISNKKTCRAIPFYTTRWKLSFNAWGKMSYIRQIVREAEGLDCWDYNPSMYY